jgi:phosphatidylglycerophosphate synthase
MAAHLLTAMRLAAVLPAALGFARPELVGPWTLAGLVALAIVTDLADGKVARHLGTASPGGMLFDHATDFLFVTACLTGAALAGVVPLVLPFLIAVAFSQYVVDSYVILRQKQLRMSRIGRWNGVLYFAPLVVLAVARLELVPAATPLLTGAARLTAYALAVSTVVSIVDRATATAR